MAGSGPEENMTLQYTMQCSQSIMAQSPVSPYRPKNLHFTPEACGIHYLTAIHKCTASGTQLKPVWAGQGIENTKL